MSLKEPIPGYKLVGEPVTRPDGVKLLIAVSDDKYIASEAKLLNPSRTFTTCYSGNGSAALIATLGEGDLQVAINRIMQILYKSKNIEVSHSDIIDNFIAKLNSS